MKILIIDDDDADRKAAARALHAGGAPGIEITEANTIARGVQHLEKQAFDVVLLDYTLPDGNGLELIKQVRKGHNEQAAVLLLGECDDDAVAEACLLSGAQDFLLKDSLQPRPLMRAIRQARQRMLMGQELKRSHDKLRELAERDALTGLSNRYFFNESLQAALLRAERYKHTVALLLLDLDHFKYINDTYGHEAGDELLKEVARRLSEAVRSGDLLCRLGGDEFAILAHHLDSDNDAWLLAHRVLGALQRETMRIGNVEVTVSASIGVAAFPTSAKNAEELLRQADLAMYRSKRMGRNSISYYSEELNEQALRRVTLERELREAIVKQQFELYFQPAICAKSGSIVAVEALLRWRHPERGLLGPGEFLDVAEDSNLISTIGLWAMEEACRYAAKWHQPLRAAAKRLFKMAVNLSSTQLRSDGIVACVRQALQQSGLSPHYLELEITESSIIEEPGRVAVMLNQLVDMGVRIALDDFGSGFSPLSHLRDFPLHVLKIDKSFLDDAETSEKGARLLKCVLALAKSQDLSTVVEGVETASQAEFVRQNEGDRMQGYFFSRPVDAAAMERMLLEGHV